jgi:hypothetical protein
MNLSLISAFSAGAIWPRAEIGQRVYKRRLLELAVDAAKAVREIAKLREEIEDPLRHRPAKGAMAAHFRTGLISNKKRARIEWIRRQWSEPVSPDSSLPASAQLHGDKARWFRAFTRWLTELEIYQPYFSVWKVDHSPSPFDLVKEDRMIGCCDLPSRRRSGV